MKWILAIAAFLTFGLFSLTVHNHSHNEQMYVTAAYLMSQGQQVYEDLAFVQMPYAPTLYSWLYGLTGGGYFLLKAKLVNYAFLLSGAGVLYWIVRRESRDPLFSGIILVLYLANYYLFRTSIEASNYTMPLAFSLIAYGLFVWAVAQVEIRADEPVPDGSLRFSIGCFLCGFFLAAAMGAKLYYATLYAPFGLALLLYPASYSLGSRLVKGVIPFGVGTVAGLLPIFLLWLRGPDRFLFNNLGYHALNTLWREQSGFGGMMTLGAKLDAGLGLLANPNYLLLVVWVALAGILFVGQRSTQAEGKVGTPTLFLSGAATVVSILTAFTPNPLFPQYFAMPVPFILLLMSALYARFAGETRQILRRLALVGALLTTLIILPRHTRSLQRFFDPDDAWSGQRSVVVSHEIRRAITDAGWLEQKGVPWVATLSPIYALETNLPIYPELATGSFVYRIGDLLSPEERARYHATSVSTLHTFLDAQPPAAILITDEGDLEMPLRDYAESRGYHAVEPTFAEGELYIR